MPIKNRQLESDILAEVRIAVHELKSIAADMVRRLGPDERGAA